MHERKNREAMELLKRILTASWTQEYKVWDEDVYWRLRLLSYICKRRTQEQVSLVRLSISSQEVSDEEEEEATISLVSSFPSLLCAQEGTLPAVEPVVMKVVVVAFTRSTGKLPKCFQEGSEDVDCGLQFRWVLVHAIGHSSIITSHGSDIWHILPFPSTPIVKSNYHHH